jgi:putative transcriptional regulator
MLSYAGSFLVARHALQDPNFRQSVVLLLQHGAEGAFGLVVNRTAKAEGVPFPVYVGGPCKAPGLMMLHGHRDWLAEASASVSKSAAPGVYVGDAESLKRITETEPDEASRFRVFTGYSGWGPGQLESELASGAWTLVPANGELLFDTPVEDLWESLVPPRLPQPSVN